MSDNLTVKIVCNDKEIPLPEYKTEGAAGVDVSASIDGEILPGKWQLVPTALYMEIPKGVEGQVRPRSGLALKHGITMLNTPGTIDSDYRGEIGVILFNASDKPFIFKKGERIAQMVFNKIETVNFIKVDSLSDSDRGSGGFGSTGRK